jgi:hypothetical protein
MRSRNLGARLAALAGSFVVLAGVGSTLGAAPAAARMNSGASLTSHSPSTCGCEPPFTIEKLQEIAGSKAGFTKSRLTGAIGQTVDYEIVVLNTGAVSQTLSEFTDPHCDEGTISGGTSRVLPEASTTYTCSHVLNGLGIFTNVASVTGTPLVGMPVTRTSNEVVVEVPSQPPPPPAPSFTIEKLQEIAGSGKGFTTSSLTGAVGQTVDYQILVNNTGNEALNLSTPIDEHCDNGTLAGGPAEGLLVPAASTTYTCSRALPSEGQYANEATITGTPVGGAPITHTSNQVVVEVPPPHHEAPAPPGKVSFSIEKLQQVAGGPVTSAKIAGVAAGSAVAYEIIVKNTSNQAITLSNFSDAHCDAGTVAGGPGTAAVAPGFSTTYTCRHVMGAEKTYVNVASVTGSAPGTAPVSKSSNQVEVEEPKQEVQCFAESHPRLRGASGAKRSPFTVQLIGGAGLAQVTFYLDGRKLKTVKQAQAKRGRFAVKIDPRKLRYGLHTLKVKLLTNNSACPASPLSSRFVDPPPKPPPPG